MKRDLTEGPITKTILFFSLPLIAGNLLQQLYNVADTLIVGRFLGAQALAAVGSAYTLMTFLTSIILGLCMGSGAVFSIRYGERDVEGLHKSMGAAFTLILLAALLLNALVFLWIDPILMLLQVPEEIYAMMRDYLWVIFWGILATFLYNYFASLLRALGNSVVPLAFLGVCALLNVALDLWFVLGLGWGVKGAAVATVFSQYVSGLSLWASTYLKMPGLRLQTKYLLPNRATVKEIAQFSFLTSLPQSVMNLGILMVRKVNGWVGTAVLLQKSDALVQTCNEKGGAIVDIICGKSCLHKGCQ